MVPKAVNSLVLRTRVLEDPQGCQEYIYYLGKEDQVTWVVNYSLLVAHNQVQLYILCCWGELPDLSPDFLHKNTSDSYLFQLCHLLFFVYMHCKENPIYVFLFWELCGLSPNFHIHVSVSDCFIPKSVHIFPCSRIGRPILEIYKSLADIWM